MRKLSLVLSAAVVALTACQGDAPATAPEVDLSRVGASWSEKVTGNGLLNAGGYTDISVSVSATDFETEAKGNVQYSRVDADLHIDVQCLNVSVDGSRVAMAGPLKVQSNTSPSTYVDGSWWRYYIETAADGSQRVRFNPTAEGTCDFTVPVAVIHTGEYKIRQ